MTKPVSMVPSHTYKLEKQALEDSERWFGDKGIQNSVPHTALALCGEVGEVANLIKKIERGSLDIRSAKVRHELSMELADVYTYLIVISGQLNLDLERAYEVKRGINETRFMLQRAEREAKINGN